MKRMIGLAVVASSFVAATAMADGLSMKPFSPNTGLAGAQGPIAGTPPNDECTDVTPVVLADGVPVEFTGNNVGATEDCPNLARPNVWHAFVVSGPSGTECMDITLDYCGTLNGGQPFGNAWLVAVGPTADCTDCGTSDIATFDTTTCGDGNVTMNWLEFRPGTYYYPVMNDPDNNAEGDYELRVVGNNVPCNILEPVPTVSEWGLIVMGLLLLIAGTIVIRRRHATETVGA